MITLDLSILNQKGTPMFYSDTLAARPAFGIAGRIFISIDSPYGIFRDTGSAWDQIAGSGGGGITGSGTLNTIAMFTPSGTAIGDSAITQTGSNVTVTARNLIVTNGAFTLSHTHNPVNGTFNPYGEQIAVTNTINAGVTWTALLAFFNTSSLQNNQWNGSASFGNGSYTTNNLNLSPITFNAAGATITSTQASGGIRAWANQILQLRIDGTNNGTYTHYANSVIYGDFAASTARFTITNRYGYLVNNLDEYSAGHTYTNRWAFYNAGINDNNFFAGKVGIGSGYTPSTFQLDVVGADARINLLSIGRGSGNLNGNSVLGVRALNVNTTGGSNVAIGYEAMISNTTGSNNTANGYNSLAINSTGSNNVAIGYDSLGANNASNNIGIGISVLRSSTGGNNIGIGCTSTLVNNTSGSFNIGIGANSLQNNNTGSQNVSLGNFASGLNTTGSNTVSIGYGALYYNQTGGNNVAIGYLSLNAIRTSNNIGLGYQAGNFITGGSLENTNPTNSIFIGYDCRANAATETNQIVIGYQATGAGSNTVTLGNTSIVKTILRGTINAANLPTSSAGLVAGDIWNNLGILNIV
jgi:hypothetical protein